MTCRRRASDSRSRNSSTPQIIIRFCGRSIRSHAVSTAEIFSRLGFAAMMIGRTERRLALRASLRSR